MDNRRVIVKVPASTANLGPGFDSLGMALSLYAWIDMSVSSGETRFELHGEQMDGVPRDKSNLIYEAAQMVFAEAGFSAPELNIAVYSDIPLTRGLGSSAATVVGALAAANALAGYPLPEQRLFHLATAWEGHPDNVGASMFGGIVVAAWDGERVDHIRLEPHPKMEVLVAIPRFQLSTEKARHALPQQFSMKDAVYNVSHSSLLVAAFASGNLAMIRHAMQDRMHQPYRAALIPGMERILKHAADHGALGAALSGAGPTLLTVVESGSDRKAELESFLLETLDKEGIQADTMWLKPVLSGLETELLNRSSDRIGLMDWIKAKV